LDKTIDAGADDRLIRHAIALGRRNLGLTWPNPSVGAVLVASGEGHRILAEGTTAPGGRPHAEPLAIAAGGAAARGGTLYVSLEPCSHHGRSPPCADAIVRAGISRVVTAIEDPDRRVAGRGHTILREAGITVVSGLRAEEAARAHRGHIARVLTGRPAVNLKLARKSDGFAGTRDGARLLITGAAATARTHLMRARSDAILVGVLTVLADDPRLDVRLPGLTERRPVRVVLDSQLRTPLSAGLVATAHTQPTWIVCTERAPAEKEAQLVDAGVEVWRVPSADGRVSPGAALLALGSRGITRLFCEGGPTLAEALAASDLVDDIVLMTGSAALPASNSPTGIPALGPMLQEALRTRFVRREDEQVGPDRIETFERIAHVHRLGE
jgi:diaminohydroxyphosphoribosylaminopyrimidine deaminase/5-amino-6-(5-phosphoribosylamino)uracil reductase